MTHTEAAAFEELMENPFVAIALTEGLHQRGDDSYFRVEYFAAEPGVASGWYSTDTDAYDVRDDDWISGPYATAKEAAEVGWYREVRS